MVRMEAQNPAQRTCCTYSNRKVVWTQQKQNGKMESVTKVIPNVVEAEVNDRARVGETVNGAKVEVPVTVEVVVKVGDGRNAAAVTAKVGTRAEVKVRSDRVEVASVAGVGSVVAVGHAGKTQIEVLAVMPRKFKLNIQCPRVLCLRLSNHQHSRLT